jgi:HAD superfamily hydrolase (TIGR01509 family)
LAAAVLGGTPINQQVTRAGEHRRALARRVLNAVSAGTLDVLDSLRENGHLLALISNATSETAEAWPQSPLARCFDVAVFSCDVGLAKPDPAIYRIAAERLGLAPGECVFVGDGADGELAGAAAVGMTVLRTVEHNDTDPSERQQRTIDDKLGLVPVPGAHRDGPVVRFARIGSPWRGRARTAQARARRSGPGIITGVALSPFPPSYLTAAVLRR